MTQLETVDFYASSRRYAEQKMESYIQKHASKYQEMLKIQNLWRIDTTVWRCNLIHSHYLLPNELQKGLTHTTHITTDLIQKIKKSESEQL